MTVLDCLQLASRYEREGGAPNARPVTISLVTNFTDGILSKLLIGYLAHHGFSPTIYAVPYKNYLFDLKNPSSALFSQSVDFTFIFFDSNTYRSSEFHLREHFDEVLNDIAGFVAQRSTTVVMQNFALPYFNGYDNLFFEHPLYKMIARANERLGELRQQYSNFHVIDTTRLVAVMGEKAARDIRGSYAFDIPFSSDFLLEVVEEWSVFVCVAAGKIKKCLVLDLDNTLWGGVVGEVGLENIILGPDYPGSAFQNFQRLLLDYHQRGIILAINSRNNPADVDEVFEKNKHMVLKKEHFAVIKCNWNNKADNLTAIAEDLNIGTDSLVFIDDDPVNRELVKQFLPEVTVPDFSLPPEEYARTLHRSRLFPQVKITAEDTAKNEMYAVENKRKEVLRATPNLDEYIKQLNISIEIHQNNKKLISRIAQLTIKTNQFNVTTRRYIERDINSFMEEGFVFAGDVTDRFGNYGLTVLSIVIPSGHSTVKLDTFLMSCRVIGRGVEKVFLEHVLTYLRQKNFTTVEADFISTMKNDPAKNFFPEAGFVLTNSDNQNNHYTYDLTNYETRQKVAGITTVVI